jgi:hypothetical protein
MLSEKCHTYNNASESENHVAIIRTMLIRLFSEENICKYHKAGKKVNHFRSSSAIGTMYCMGVFSPACIAHVMMRRLATIPAQKK